MKKKLKIKRIIFKHLIWFFLFLTLFYTRFVNLNWGLPFPMHPDERNMAIALQNLRCEISDLLQCANPHFFAYGQLSLYLGYIVVLFMKFVTNNLGKEISFYEAVLSLRIISAIASVINAYIVLKIFKIVKKTKEFNLILFFLVIIFSPFFIQFSHFGTTESLLMLFYSTLVYFCFKMVIDEKFTDTSLNKKIIYKKIFLLALISALLVATKISSLIFLVLPSIFIVYFNHKKFSFKLSLLIFYLFFSLLLAIFFSPHNLLNFNEFKSSLMYEKVVADGTIKVFYNRQFLFSKPIIFQLLKIYPYALGQLNFILLLLGFFLTPWKDKKNFFLKLAFLVYFLPSSFLFVKWTRFQAPVFPLALVFVFLFLSKIKKKLILFLTIFICILPGLAYLSVYKNEDVRIVASEWISENFSNNSTILSETANVVDIPYVTRENKNKFLNLVSFNFYDLDKSFQLQLNLKNYLYQADYILIPSRRIVYNYTCLLNENDWAYFSNRCYYLKSNYPQLENYYKKILYDNNNFQLIKTFTSYPKITLFGKTLIQFTDEEAEETWTVFDHPVIRIFKKINKNPV